MNRPVVLRLTHLEASQLYQGANMLAEELRRAEVGTDLGMSSGEVRAFWSALGKLQDAQRRAGAGPS